MHSSPLAAAAADAPKDNENDPKVDDHAPKNDNDKDNDDDDDNASVASDISDISDISDATDTSDVSNVFDTSDADSSSDPDHHDKNLVIKDEDFQALGYGFKHKWHG